jgi:hypothetical protein
LAESLQIEDVIALAVIAQIGELDGG